MNILTIDGYKNILDCPIGTLIKAYEVGTGNVIWNELLKIDEWTEDYVNALNENLPPECQIEWKWYLINGTYKVFAYQSIWTTPTTVKHCFQIEVGDTIYSDEDEDIIVISFEETAPDDVWYRLLISNDHSFIADGITLHNASRYWRGTTSTDWGSINNWSSTSGGATGSSVPTSADDVTFDVNGNNNCSLTTANRVCLSLTFTSGYTATFDFTATTTRTLTVSGNVTLGSNVTITGSGELIVNATSTLKSNGKTLPVALTLRSNVVYTLADNWTVTGTFSVGNTGAAHVINGFKVNIKGDLFVSGVSSVVGGGTTVFEMNGTGTQTWRSSGGNTISNDLIFNSTGTIVCASIISGSSVLGFRYKTITYLSGTMVTAGSQLSLALTPSLDTSGMTWGDVTIGASGSQTITLLSDVYCNSLTLNPAASIHTFNGNTIHITDALTVTAIGGQLAGTSVISLEGSATINTNITGTGFVASPITINSSSVTITGTLYKTGTFTMNTNFSGSSSLELRGASTLNCNNNAVGGLTINAAGITISLSSNLRVSSSFTSIVATSASKVSFVSNSPGTQRKLTLQQGATQDIGFTNFTDIDAGDGQTIWVWKPTLSNTNNIKSLTYPGTTYNTF